MAATVSDPLGWEARVGRGPEWPYRVVRTHAIGSVTGTLTVTGQPHA